MQKFQKLALVLAMAGALAACDKLEQKADAEAAAPAAGEALALSTDTQKVSYGLGLTTANQMRQSGITLDVDAYKSGFDDAMAGIEARISEAEFNAAREVVIKEMQEKQKAEAAIAGEKNIAAAATFLAENGAREGVVTTASGLQYEILTAGDGAIPAATDTVEVHYVGTFLDGTEFDSSVSRGQPVSFPVGGVIPGWTEALQLMPVGSKWKLYIPADLAYGPGGTGNIPPNATLVFEVELLSIQAAAAAAGAAEVIED